MYATGWNWAKSIAPAQSVLFLPHGKAEARQSTEVQALSIPARLLLFCVASRTGWERAGITRATVTTLVVRRLIERRAGGPPTKGRGACGATRRGRGRTFRPAAVTSASA
jgi:hypothetical protein